MLQAVSDGVVSPPSFMEGHYALSTFEWLRQTYDGRMDYAAVATTTPSKSFFADPRCTWRRGPLLHRDALLARGRLFGREPRCGRAGSSEVQTRRHETAMKLLYRRTAPPRSPGVSPVFFAPCSRFFRGFLKPVTFIGAPRFETSGPHRPERCALPGCRHAPMAPVSIPHRYRRDVPASRKATSCASSTCLLEPERFDDYGTEQDCRSRARRMSETVATRRVCAPRAVRAGGRPRRAQLLLVAPRDLLWGSGPGRSTPRSSADCRSCSTRTSASPPTTCRFDAHPTLGNNGASSRASIGHRADRNRSRSHRGQPIGFVADLGRGKATRIVLADRRSRRAAAAEQVGVAARRPVRARNRDHGARSRSCFDAGPARRARRVAIVSGAGY